MLNQGDENARMEYVFFIFLGVAAGLIGGMMGIGGGMIIVPALVLVWGLEQHLAQGVSLSVVAVTSLVGAATHYRQGTMRLQTVLWVVPLAVGFGFLGAQLATNLDGKTLSRIFGVVVLTMSVVMLAGKGSD